MDIRQLHYFLVLCDEMNYSRAAQRLFLSRQALRQRISALEAELCWPLFLAAQYVDRSTAVMQRQLEAAYALAEQGDYPAARRAYSRAANRALRSTQVLGLLVRRNILDQLAQTLAVLPPCSEADSLADLEPETQRACTQIEQVRQSFFSGF